jgi:hypothetical protein
VRSPAACARCEPGRRRGRARFQGPCLPRKLCVLGTLVRKGYSQWATGCRCQSGLRSAGGGGAGGGLPVVDEFGELLAARPEFLELFTAIGRIGRSLGIHLLLSSQRLDEGRAAVSRATCAGTS